MEASYEAEQAERYDSSGFVSTDHPVSRVLTNFSLIAWTVIF